MLKGDGRVRMAQDLIFYNNKISVDGSVTHHGDNITGYVGDKKKRRRRRKKTSKINLLYSG